MSGNGGITMSRNHSYVVVLVLLTLIAGLSGVLGNVASSTLPVAWQPYLWLAWPLFVILLLATVGLVIWQARLERKITVSGETSQEKPTSLPLPVPQIPNNLPPRSEFIGRDAEKGRVHEALRSRSYLVSIDGIGGIGKTSLALEVTHECLRASQGADSPGGIARFNGFIWTTAKDRDLTLNALLDAVARTLEYPGIVQQPAEEKRSAVCKLLQEKSHLLIVDNFETITDAGVRDFLLELPEPSKALITTREQKLPQVRAISLKGLTEPEALALIHNEGSRLGLVSLEHAEDRMLLHLYQATDGAPLAIKWAVGQIKQKGQSLDTVLASLHEARGSVFDSIFTRSWGLLSAGARQVLIVMPIFATSASRAGIEAASDVHHFVLDEALGQLVEMFLVDATDDLDLARRRYSIHPLTRAFAKARLQREAESQVFEHILAYYAQLVAPPKKMEVGVRYWDYLLFDYAWAQSLEQEWDNLDYVIRRALDEGRDAAALELFLPIVHVLNVWGLWDKRLQLSRQMCQAANRLGDSSEAWLWIDAIGYILSHQRTSEWEEVLQKGRAVAEQFGLPDALILVASHEALLHSCMGDSDLAVGKIESILEQCDASSAPGYEKVRQIVAARAFASAGWVYRWKGETGRAKRFFERELELRRSIGENPAPVLARLGHLSLILKDVPSAEKFLIEALETAGPKDIAQINYDLAQVARRKGEVQKAQRLGELALEQFARLGRERDVGKCQELLDRLSRQYVETSEQVEREEGLQTDEE
ncbi:MAG TPA: NB-ARC domain-containing protein [Anaerolineae bacterium]|nr:NB-ARC domain-containing protein [Anaerolineae bacterium]